MIPASRPNRQVCPARSIFRLAISLSFTTLPVSSSCGLLGGERGIRVLAPWGGSHPRADDELYSESWGSCERPRKAERDYWRFFQPGVTTMAFGIDTLAALKDSDFNWANFKQWKGEWPSFVGRYFGGDQNATTGEFTSFKSTTGNHFQYVLPIQAWVQANQQQTGSEGLSVGASEIKIKYTYIIEYNRIVLWNRRNFSLLEKLQSV